MNIRLVINELNAEINPKEEELRVLHATRTNIQNMCSHEETTSWETYHGTPQEFFTCKICDKEWIG